MKAQHIICSVPNYLRTKDTMQKFLTFSDVVSRHQLTYL